MNVSNQNLRQKSARNVSFIHQIIVRPFASDRLGIESSKGVRKFRIIAKEASNTTKLKASDKRGND